MTSQPCLVVMYHYVRDSAATPFPDIRALTPALFARQLDWLQREFTVIDLAQLAAALGGGPPLPPDAALLTFDDGLIDHYRTVLPVLCARGLTGVFFLTGDTVSARPRMAAVHKTHFLLAALGAQELGREVRELCAESLSASARSAVFGLDSWDRGDERALKQLLNYDLPFEAADEALSTLVARHLGDETAFARTLYLSEAMVGEMARAGMHIGYHTRSHRMLSRLTPQEQADELRDGPDWVRRLTGQQAVSFCYPWGGPQTYTADTLRLLTEAGYTLAFNTVRRRLDAARDPRFELPRIDTRDLPPHEDGHALAEWTAARV